MVWLRDIGHEVIGCELSPLAVEGFFKDNGLDPVVESDGDLVRWSSDGITLFCGDIFDLTSDRVESPSALYDRASIVSMPRDQRALFAQHLAGLLDAESSGLLISFEYPQDEMEGPPFSVSQNELITIFSSFEINHLASHDVLEDHPRFQSQGVTQLHDQVYSLRRSG